MAGRNPAQGPIIYNLFPLLAGTIAGWKRELPRIAAMGFNTVFVNPFHCAGASRSIYAIKDVERIDSRFKDRPDDDDRVIKTFIDAARAHGLDVMFDLVINHAARNSVLLERHPEFFARDPSGRLVTPFAVDPIAPDHKTYWPDLAQFDYGAPASRDALIDFWSRYIRRFQRLGVSAFRCDACHMIDAQIWRELLDRAHRFDPSTRFVGETLGCTLDRAVEMAGAGFDYIMNNFNYGDFERLPMLDEYHRLHRLVPSIAFPESHDTARFAAGFDAVDPGRVARELRARYMLAALFSSGVLMPMGFEWGYRTKFDVARTTRDDREDTGIDISADILAINQLRGNLRAANVEGRQLRLSPPGRGYLALLRYDAQDRAKAGEAMLVLANTGSEPRRIAALDILAEMPDISMTFREATPASQERELRPADLVVLEPAAVRVFSGRKPDGEHRITPVLTSFGFAAGREGPRALEVCPSQIVPFAPSQPPPKK